VKRLRSCLALAWSGALLTTLAHGAEPSVEDRAAVHWIAQEVEIARVLDALSQRGVRGTVLYRDVAVVDAVSGKAVPHQSVLARSGRIAWVGDAVRAPADKDALVVDGSGLFLSPGLTDMHVHTESLGEQILRLATGETSVRDMDGFPWMLRLRRAARAGLVLTPTTYIAGTIIADHPYGGYTVVITTDGEARQQVINQAACGYDFIKVHNRLAQPLFDAVADQARRSGKDLVGHVPHDITIDHAVHVGGMRTLEHLKGFYYDKNLKVSDEDFRVALKGAAVWLTPTLYTVRQAGLHGESARRELARPEMRYARSAQRQDWTSIAFKQPDWRDRLATILPAWVARVLSLNTAAMLQDRLAASVATILPQLLPLHPHWLAGTDAAGYDFNIAGYALLDELLLMQQYGIAKADVLRAATSEPAVAMRQRADFGRISPGMRADLVLLAGDPTKDLSVFHANLGVMVHGVWLERSALDDALRDLARIYGESDVGFVMNAAVSNALASEVVSLSAKNITLDPKRLIPAADALRRAGYARAAQQLSSADTDDRPGPCFEILPEGE
jgi:hypothetical protein